MSKLFLKEWLQVFNNVNKIFLLTKLISNFYDMYIMYSQSNFIFLKILYIIFLALQSKIQKIK